MTFAVGEDCWGKDDGRFVDADPSCTEALWSPFVGVVLAKSLRSPTRAWIFWMVGDGKSLWFIKSRTYQTWNFEEFRKTYSGTNKSPTGFNDHHCRVSKRNGHGRVQRSRALVMPRLCNLLYGFD